MSQTITVNPTAGASTNPLGITFGATAKLEFKMLPEKLINKDVTGINLTMIDTVGIYLNKGPLRALIPWGALIDFEY